jgi:hypothetical protein
VGDTVKPPKWVIQWVQKHQPPSRVTLVNGPEWDLKPGQCLEIRKAKIAVDIEVSGTVSESR